ncbi:MAG: Arc family DNA-binding protein [Clostridia bacterium]|jgi:predicted transcriptional regulator|nr:Arc family DNA-binding protein [Clostridia bacterium]MBQ1965612.1 Arc family DNA-binding protein [Clostridia bacterium]
MRGNYYQPFSLRISEEMHHKLRIIAENHKRSENKEIEFALAEYVRRYEETHGVLPGESSSPESK